LLVNSDYDSHRIAGGGYPRLINSFGQLGGLAGPAAIGFLNVRTHSIAASFGLIALAYVAAGGLLLRLKIRNPLDVSQRSNQSEK
jgi:hypothetical protein